MFEALCIQSKPLQVGMKLIAGDLNLGYYGVIGADKFITGDTLANAIGLTAGTSQYSDAGWLKFAYNGKTLYLAKKPLRYGASWNDIYLAGAVYGDDTNGLSPPNTLRAQNARVTIGTKTYRVRLILVSTADPSTTGSAGRELAALVPKVLASQNHLWDALSDSDFGIPTDTTFGNAALSLGQETYTNNTRIAYPKNPYGLVTAGPTSSTANIGWRPVLELIP